MQKPLHVVVAVIIPQGMQRHVLIAKRPKGKFLEGLWEFPGGKVEPGETPEIALKRELKEELNIDIGSMQPFLQLIHEYVEYSVFLDIWLVTKFYGEPQGLENQIFQWIPLNHLRNYQFPDANLPILEKLEKI